MSRTVSAGESALRVVLADDSGLLRESLAALLERQGFTVVAQCDSAQDIPPLIDANPEVDLLVTDVRMPPRMSDDGIRAAHEVHRRHPGVGIVVCSQYVAPAYARSVMELADGRCGVGYVLKDSVSHVADFVRTLRTVAGRGLVIEPAVAQALVGGPNPGFDALTLREREVLGLMSEGLSNGEIAQRLVVSAAAVAKHVAAIFLKLGMGPEEDNRRVRAVLQYLAETGGAGT